MDNILTFPYEPARSRYARYRLDPVFERTPDGAVIGIIRYQIYLDGRFVGSRRTHAQCHNLLDELIPPEPDASSSLASFASGAGEQPSLASRNYSRRLI